MKQYHVYSTITADNAYTFYKDGGAGVNTIEETILIKGGANLADKRTLLTPNGAMTLVTESQLERLRSNRVFQMHEKNGFITIMEKAVDVDVVVADMERRDESSPVTPQDFTEETEGAKPLVIEGDKKQKGRVKKAV